MRHYTDPKRGGFYAENPEDPENALSVIANEAGGLFLAVCDEQAVDSYNEMFELTLELSREQAVALRDYLNQQFPP